MTVLVIATHPDDDAIGCGGTMNLHSLPRGCLFSVFLTSGKFITLAMEPVLLFSA